MLTTAHSNNNKGSNESYGTEGTLLNAVAIKEEMDLNYTRPRNQTTDYSVLSDITNINIHA